MATGPLNPLQKGINAQQLTADRLQLKRPTISPAIVKATLDEIKNEGFSPLTLMQQLNELKAANEALPHEPNTRWIPPDQMRLIESMVRKTYTEACKMRVSDAANGSAAIADEQTRAGAIVTTLANSGMTLEQMEVGINATYAGPKQAAFREQLFALARASQEVGF